MAVTSFDTPLIKKEQNSVDAWNFMFEKPKGFKYKAGQYIKMKLKIDHPDDRGTTRYFTLSSSPNDDYLMVTTRILKSSFKMRLQEVKIGEKVHMRGPWGDFFLTPRDKMPRVLIAGGIGMTPYHSMLRYAYQNKLNLPLLLLVSYKTPDEILYKEELEEIMSKNNNIKIITTVTQPVGFDWVGITGRIDKNFIKDRVYNLSKYVYYIAGPDPMVEGMEKTLSELGIKKENIVTDGFPGY